jgi:exopolysaccharide production protein ExoQ
MTSGLRTLAERVRARPAPVIAWVATFALTFLTTLGPVYSVRLGMGPLTTDFVDDATIQVFFAGFYALLIVMLTRCGPRRPLRRSLFLPLTLFCAVALASTQWSVDQPRTLTQAIMLSMTAAAGIAAGQATSVASQITAVFASQQLGAVLSLIAVIRHAPRWDDPYGHWAGIYFNRNSLGPVAALGLMATVGCAGMLWTRAKGWDRRAIVLAWSGLLVAAAIDILLLKGSGSFTPLLALAVAALGVVAVLVLRHGSRSPARDAGRNTAIVLAGLTMLLAIAWFARSTLLPVVGKGPTLEARTPIWHVIIKFADQRPFRGWGWIGIWHFPDFARSVSALHLSQPIGEAHNGFLEVYLGTGLLGLGLIVLFALLVLWATSRQAVLRSGIALWTFAVVLYAVIVNQLESFIGANLLPWVLLTMAAASVTMPRHRAIREEANRGPAGDGDAVDVGSDPRAAAAEPSP